MQNLKQWIILGAVAFVILIGGCQYVSVRNNIVAKENALTAQAINNSADYSDMVLTAVDSVSFINLNADNQETLAGIIVNGLNGGFDLDGELSNSNINTAIHSAFPDIGAAEATQLVQTTVDTINGKRANWTANQKKLSDQVRNYKTYINTGVMRPMIASAIGAPTDLVKYGRGADAVFGTPALHRMEELVIAQQAVEDYQSGVAQPLDITGNDDE